MDQVNASRSRRIACPLCGQGHVWVVIGPAGDQPRGKISARHDCPACAAEAQDVSQRLTANGWNADASESLDQVTERIRHFEKAVQVCKHGLGESHLLAGELLLALGVEYFASGDYQQARQAFEGALPFALDKGVALPSTADLVARLSAALEALGDIQAQARLLKDLRDRAGDTVGAAHPVTLGWTVSLGHILLHLEEHRAAKSCFENGLEALDAAGRLDDDDPYGLYGKLPDLLTGLGPLEYHQALCSEGLADACRGLKLLDEARAFYGRALSIWNGDTRGILKDNFMAQLNTKVCALK